MSRTPNYVNIPIPFDFRPGQLQASEDWIYGNGDGYIEYLKWFG